jgi:hypothetical protein
MLRAGMDARADYVSYTGLNWAASRPRVTPWEIDRYLTRY